jgi:hypothetical protein
MDLEAVIAELKSEGAKISVIVKRGGIPRAAATSQWSRSASHALAARS